MLESLPATVRTLLAALRMLLVLTVITGVAYPLVVTGIAQAAFSHKANGSEVERGGRVVGSSLLGQNFDLPKKNPDNADEAPRPDPRFFQPRPSAGGYDPLASGASNLGPNNPDLISSIRQRQAAIAAFDGVSPDEVPPDAVTTSGSGLDPDISPAYAHEQVDRVARARGLSPATVRRLVADNTHGRVLGFLGQKHVNVLKLNLALTRVR
ncbi:K+-transporting ATPase ATPase C chain [Streptomyces sp. DvalAA-14]|uniref:potassium-transporting ATPase subunit KdpC n=1 Tax=unclassified Streptomyces TaxID=2593676 RepID=UPI00081B1CB7|nr:MULTISPECIES: potassium-transporting ATPase subunit KdpC [unclassified Streptomyces]MYS25291.1 potassium-transporting ATPase subunit KdpC [Streptomyces sp. SID4948]SCE53520.1 K+-transporting ATPase ATPase C chain [Streptomyces sp. DvalAA-14]